MHFSHQLTLLLSREAVSIEDPDAFFPLLHAVTDASVFPLPSERSSPAHAHQHVLETALALDYLAEPGAYVSAEMHVALHSASPKLEAFYQYYADHHATRTEGRTSCGSWVDWYGEVVCDAETLAHLVQTASIDAPGAAESQT